MFEGAVAFRNNGVYLDSRPWRPAAVALSSPKSAHNVSGLPVEGARVVSYVRATFVLALIAVVNPCEPLAESFATSAPSSQSAVSPGPLPASFAFRPNALIGRLHERQPVCLAVSQPTESRDVRDGVRERRRTWSG